MPKVCSLSRVSWNIATFLFCFIGGLAGLAIVGCNQEKPPELKAPPTGPPTVPHKVNANSAADATQPVSVTLPPVAPATPDTSTKPVAGADVGQSHVEPGLTTPPTLPTSRSEIAVPIELSARGPKPGVTPLPTTVPSSEPAAGPALPTTNPATTEPAESRPAAHSFTGTLHGGVVAVGSETTGWALNVDGGTGALDIDVTAISGQVRTFDGRHVTITGQLKEKNWVERGKTQLLIADTIAIAPIPEMNK